jgi:Fe-S-cluster containining protein
VKGVPFDVEKARRQAAASASVESWSTLPVEDRWCIYLDGETKLCRIYADRPGSCRLHRVVSDPELCDWRINPMGRVLNYQAIEAEMLESGYIHTQYPKLIGTIPEMALRVLGD